jgi:AcrR family transcriptional regulator
VAELLTSRAREIVAVARDLLESDGAEALTMRRLADALGIRAPSLYKHLPHKGALETAIIIDGFEEAARAFEEATEGAAEPLKAFVDAYRTFARAHPHVYRLMTERPLPRDRLPPGLEARTAAPLLRATGSPPRARAAWAFIHGMVMLELNERFPADGQTDLAWQAGVAAFETSPSPPDQRR